MGINDKPTVEQIFIYVLLQYSEGLPVDPGFSPVVNKMVRQGYLGKSVVTGEITISSYGLKLLDRLDIPKVATKVN